jgi:hypothetical protein
MLVWHSMMAAVHPLVPIILRSERLLIFLQRYLWLYIIILKSFLVYLSDIFTATTMLTTSTWSNQIFNDCQHQDGCFYIPFNVGKWLFVGCIIFGFLLVCCSPRQENVSLIMHSWRTKPENRRKSLPVVISLTLSRT